MAKAIITMTPNGKMIQIEKNDGKVPGMNPNEKDFMLCELDHYINDNVSLVTAFGKKIELRVGEVDQIGNVTDLDTTQKIKDALIVLTGV